MIKVITGIKAVAGIEFIVFLAVAEFDITIVARNIYMNELMTYIESVSGCLE